MSVITRKELNDWKKTFKLGDKVKVVGENKYQNQEGIITKKNSYVYVDLNVISIGFRGGLEVVEPVVKTIKKRQVFTNKLKEGDWITTPYRISNSCSKVMSKVCRVYRTTDKSFWVEVPFLKRHENGITWSKFAVSNYKIVNGKISESDYLSDEDWTIPYNCNKEDFDFFRIEKSIRVSEFESKKYSVITDENKQGYSYKYIYR